MKNLYSLLVFLVFFASCTRVTIPNKQKTPTPFEYEEDLSVIRPQYEVKGTKKNTSTKSESSNKPVNIYMTVNRLVDIVLDSMAIRNQPMKYAQGFRIQIYVGNSREEVDDTKKIAYKAYPELSPYMSFSQPTYKLKIGDFITKFDAERYLGQIKGQFGTALIIPDKVEVKKSIYIK